MHSVPASLIDQHWMWMFGISAEDYFQASLFVTAHNSPFFEGYWGAWVFKREGRVIITVPPPLLDEIRAKAMAAPHEFWRMETEARGLFGDRVNRVIGPVYQGAAEAVDFQPSTLHATQRLVASDQFALAALLRECDPSEVEDSGIRIDSDRLIGCYLDGRLVSAAREIDIGPFAMTIGIITHPSFRGQGYGKTVVSAGMAAILAQGKAVAYQTLLANSPSVRLATALGCRDYARHVAVRLR